MFYNCDEAGIYVRAYGTGDIYKIENNIIANNIILNCGMDSGTDQANLGIKVDNHGNIGANVYRNNCVYNTNGQTNIIFYRDDSIVSVGIFNSRNVQTAI